MKYRTLGNTGISVSEIGFGAWGIGGNSYGTTDDKESKKALLRAFELGINFFDTSDLYGDGHSEKLIGESLSKCRNKIVIVTKGGTLSHTGVHMPQDFSVKHIRSALENSLKRLKTDYVDLYLLHSPTLSDITDELVKLLEEFKDQGKIKEIGVSVRSPADGLAILDSDYFKAIEVNFNMIDQRALEIGLFEKASPKEVGTIIRTPLCFGYLTGKLTGDEKFIGIDHRKNWTKEQLKTWANSSDLFSVLNNNGNRTPAQLALKFCLSFDAVSVVIPGMLNCKEVEENCKTSELKNLSKEEIKQIRLIYESNLFFDKNAKGAMK